MDINWVRKLASVAARAPSADNAQPWVLRWDGRELAVIFAQREGIKSIFPADSHATLLSVGAVIENIETAISANAVCANWHWPAEADTGRPYASVAISGTLTDFVSPKGLTQRHTNRFPFLSKPLPTELLTQLGNYREDNIRVALLIDSSQKSELARLVQTCSEARFCTRELHEWLSASLRFTAADIARGDGLDIASLALPPGGALFFQLIADWKRMSLLNRLGLYKLMALDEASLLPKAPALLCIVGRSDRQSTISGGRLMNRIWMELNLRDIGVHPYYVVTDQLNRFRAGKINTQFERRMSRVKEETRRLLSLQSGETLHMILRIGYPKQKPVRSERLPLESIFQDARASSSSSL